MTSAWEAIRGDSRRVRRYRLRLLASIIIFEGIEEGHSPAILAFTRDISREGLCLIMPTAADSCRGLEQDSHILRIGLVLPDGTKINLVGSSIYCYPHRADDFEVEFLVGVKLKRLADLAIYREFIADLAR